MGMLRGKDDEIRWKMNEHGRIADICHCVVDSKPMMPNLLGLAGWIHISVKRNLEWGSVINIDCECFSSTYPFYPLPSYSY